MATHEEIKAAAQNDVGDWGEKDISGAYPPETRFAGVKVSELEEFAKRSRAAAEKAVKPQRSAA